MRCFLHFSLIPSSFVVIEMGNDLSGLLKKIDAGAGSCDDLIDKYDFFSPRKEWRGRKRGRSY